MSFNIVGLVKDQIQGQLMGHMGNLLGNEGGKATGAVDSMIPALLNSMSGTASTDEGANNLFGAIQNQDDSLLDNMGSLLGGGQAATVVDNGNSVLSGLFGSGGLGKLAGALSAFSGVSKGGTSSLMGMLAPIILGVLKRKVMGDGLNAGGLANMLSSQSNNISASMPQGLGDQLGASGLLGGISGFGAAGAGAAAGAAGAVGAGAANLASSARGAAGNVGGAVGDVADGARDGVANMAGGARDGVANVAGGARDGVANAAGAVSGGVSSAAGSARDGVANVAGGARDGVANAAGNVRDGVDHRVDTVRDDANYRAGSVDDGSRKGGSMFRWLLPLVALGALAWAAFTFLLPGAKDAATDAGDGAAAVAETASDATESATETATDAAATATDAAADATEATAEAASDATDAAAGAVAGAVDPEAIKGQLGDVFSGAGETLGGITDVDTANAALPDLQKLGENVDSVSGIMENIPEDARGPISSIASEGMGTLQPIVDKVMGIDGVGDVVGPVLTPILDKLKAFGG